MTQVANQNQFTASERFTQAVLREYGSNVGEVKATEFQKKLSQNYFVKLDTILKGNERKRLAKDEKYRDPLAFTWENVNIPKLATDVVNFSAIGLDPLQPNHINLIPYKNSGTNKFDIGFIIGYVGIEIKAKKYGFDVPDSIIIELVYSTDEFKSYKKDKNNDVESYEFNIINDFERGEIIGGFYYYLYKSNPEKNKLRVMPIKEILKHKPEYASAEFWGGEKDVWTKDKNGKNVKEKQTVEGWFEAMCYKTVARAAFNGIAIDSEKIDAHLVAALQREAESNSEPDVKAEIDQNANKQKLDFEEGEATVMTGTENAAALEAKVEPIKVEPVKAEPVKQETPPDPIEGKEQTLGF